MPLRTRGFVLRLVGVDDQRRAQPPFRLAESPLAKTGQQQNIDHAPVMVTLPVDHRLAELVLAIDALDRVDLVDHVDQMLRFGHAPEHRVDPDAPLVVPVYMQPEQFADVGMLAPRVLAVRAQEQFDSPQIVAPVPLTAPLRLERQRDVVVELLVELRLLAEGHGFERDVAREFRNRLRGEKEETDADRQPPHAS